jgi:hypothetical protein
MEEFIKKLIDDMFVGLKIYKDINRDTGNGKIFFHKNGDVLMSIWKRGNSYDLFISSKLFSSSKLRYVNFGDGNWENILTDKIKDMLGIEIGENNVHINNKSKDADIHDFYKYELPKEKKGFFNRLSSYFTD